MTGTIVITGANGSLALGFVQWFLALYPQHTLVATVRNRSAEDDPNTAKLLELISRHANARVLIEILDLGKLADVRCFSERLSHQVSSRELPPILAIICNASTWSLQAGVKFSSDGYENTFQICHLSHYLLILKLLDRMDPASGRIIMLGSITHYPEKSNPVSSLGPEFPSDMEQLIHPLPDQPALVHDRGFQRYATAKLANVTMVNDLNNRLQKDPKLSDLTALAMDPGGLSSSTAQAEQKPAVRRLMMTIDFFMPVLKHFTTMFRTTKDAGRDLVAISVDPRFKGKRGYFVGQEPGKAAAISHDVNVQRKLWESCWKWTGLSPSETVLQSAAPRT